jgi:hypothetical protein
MILYWKLHSFLQIYLPRIKISFLNVPKGISLKFRIELPHCAFSQVSVTGTPSIILIFLKAKRFRKLFCFPLQAMGNRIPRIYSRKLASVTGPFELGVPVA